MKAGALGGDATGDAGSTRYGGMFKKYMEVNSNGGTNSCMVYNIRE